MSLITTCSCGRAITFVTMVSGKRMPVDSARATVVMVDASGGSGVVAKAWIPHWITCPRRDAYREVNA